MMFNLPELVIFDLDNTLYDYESANSAGEKALINFLHENNAKAGYSNCMRAIQEKNYYGFVEGRWMGDDDDLLIQKCVSFL